MFTSYNATDERKIANSYLSERMWCLFKDYKKKKLNKTYSNLLNKRKESKRLRIWNFNPTFLFYTYIIYKSFTLTVVSDFEINVTLE